MGSITDSKVVGEGENRGERLENGPLREKLCHRNIKESEFQGGGGGTGNRKKEEEMWPVKPWPLKGGALGALPGP